MSEKADFRDERDIYTGVQFFLQALEKEANKKGTQLISPQAK